MQEEPPQKLQAENVLASSYVLLNSSDATAPAEEVHSRASENDEKEKPRQPSPVVSSAGEESAHSASSPKAEAPADTNEGPDEAAQQKGCNWWKKVLENHPRVAKGVNFFKNPINTIRRSCGGRKEAANTEAGRRLGNDTV
uniref:Uncharacterized protein n=1 Tax=Chromera velia CCMP2878 TaxID=1169474 RepID=A0A0G4GQ62_9ALVE|eukprot:Cvel_703.t1-p1 / transcript=Cvel_703.t1 / gene=Cvel_703 / organism=Chromera_velia_CCMP2878 / gene_product=hypothetical protein / transcript_product=hypothetical protein / location=Cvel_scaffold22:12345-12764(-) / protein_length=140 / sequence_SO=supercontig / SO=protein_coding / is_pseudo=false